MVHPGGFEPPTARFVAEYSIQLSYGCIGKLALLPILIPLRKRHQVRDGASGRITRLRLALRVVAKATLFSLVLAIISQTLKQQRCCYSGEYGASGRIRTSDRSVRSRVLYPAELRMHRETYFTADSIPLLKRYLFSVTTLMRYLREDGASGRIRTSDRSVRSRVLYPAELRMQMAVRRGFEPRMQLLTAYSLSRGAPSASRPPHQQHLLRVLRRTCFCSSSLCGAHITFWDL